MSDTDEQVARTLVDHATQAFEGGGQVKALIRDVASPVEVTKVEDIGGVLRLFAKSGAIYYLVPGALDGFVTSARNTVRISKAALEAAKRRP